jgi:glycogen phosphorylase
MRLMKHPKFSHTFEVAYELPDALKPLRKLANNFRWTWHHDTRQLFRDIDKPLWDAVEHNPVELLRRLPAKRQDQLANDTVFLVRLKHCADELEAYLSEETWFDRTYPEKVGKVRVAYFCAEFGVSEGLPIYSGGLGVLAGDHLKAASDQGIPLVAVGLLYGRGYFRQFLGPDGWQQEHYPQYDFYSMPLTLMRGEDEKPIRIEVEMPDRVVTCNIWRADIGRIPLYLLDSNVLENEPDDQGITDTLYGGDEEMRIRQEMILGIGGMRALKALGLEPTVCHLNEGHAAFLAIERIRQYMEAHNCDFRTARQICVSGNVFTTHTPVPAGFDLFTPQLLERYMGHTIDSVGISFAEFLRLGRIDPENHAEAFNMAVLAMENSNHVNGVSKLHAKVTREMFHARWPHYPEEEVPIEPVTNGIHTMTWVSWRMARLFDKYLGEHWRRDPSDPDVWDKIWEIPDAELWEIRENQRGDLVRFVRKRMQRDYERRNGRGADHKVVNSILDPRILTIGFARRFATYKRATLMLHDRERLKQLLFHADRPVQIVIAGKSHPRDDGGKKLIQDLFNFIEHDGGRARMVFLEDYDMRVARMLVQGVDVWLNNPRRPMEASGTSGMKVVPNGGLNCSILDGWWDEGYEPGVGWAIGGQHDVLDQGQQDWLDSRSFYSLLEHEIAQKFYHRVDSGIPVSWIEMMKRSIIELAPVFSTARMVREYTSKFYMPAAESHLKMLEGGVDLAKETLSWRKKVQGAWPMVRIAAVTDSIGISSALGEDFCVRAQVDLGTLTPEEVRVQALFGQVGPNRDLLNPHIHELDLVGQEDGAHIFEGSLTANTSGYRGYTVRVIPRHEHISIPSELALATWEA